MSDIIADAAATDDPEGVADEVIDLVFSEYDRYLRASPPCVKIRGSI